MKDDTNRAPKKNDHYGLSMGIGLGLAIGVGVGLLTDNLAVWLGSGLAVGLAFGLLYDDKQKKRDTAAQVKTDNGATFTLVKRSNPVDEQRSHYWLGDNGQELELTDTEAVELL